MITFSINQSPWQWKMSWKISLECTCRERQKYEPIEETIKLWCLSTKLMFILLSQATCNALGAYLTEIESEDEHEFIEDIKKKSMFHPYFIFYERKPSVYPILLFLHTKVWGCSDCPYLHTFDKHINVSRSCCALVDWSHRLWSGWILDLVSVKKTSKGKEWGGKVLLTELDQLSTENDLFFGKLLLSIAILLCLSVTSAGCNSGLS